MSTSVASKVPFSDFCQLCERISKASKEKKYELLNKYISYYREYGERLKSSNPDVDTSFYPVMRLFLPHMDRERGAYGVKEHALAQIYIRILCLAKGELDAEKLLNYRAPKTAGSLAGDFAEVAFWVLKKFCSEGGKLTIEQINTYLDNIAIKNADNDRRGMEAELVTMLQAMSAFDQKWLIRIILKDMKLGVGHNKILSSFHPDARDLYDVSNNLQKVCTVLKDPLVRLHEAEVEIFSSFRPMLAEQCDVQKIDEFFTSCPVYYIETKHDGERFQLHYKNGMFKYFSRNGYEYTEGYGQTRYDGVFSPRFAKLMKRDVKNFIIDGEMMVWDKKNNFLRAKGENIVDVKAMKKDSNLQPCFYAFDVLLYNDQVLTNKPIENRLKFISFIFEPEEGTAMFTERKKVTNKEQVMTELNKAIDSKLEGIMLKKPGTVYKPNHRRAGWYKIKPEYTDGLMDHLDTIIMGGYYGEGRRSGFISHFLVGLAVTNPEGEPVMFHSLTRVGSGYTMTKLEELLSKLNPHWQRVLPGECPPSLEWGREKPDVWIAPKDSYILQIKATEIVDSSKNTFKTQYTLRFPRVEDIRYDKKWNECTTTVEFEALRQHAAGKLYSRHVAAESGDGSKKKRKIIQAAPTVAKQFKPADLTQVEKVSDFLRDKEFCVITGDKKLAKHDIEEKIHQHGGTVVQNPGSKTFCVIAGTSNVKVTNISKSQKYDVVHVGWLQRCVDEGSLLDWTPADLLGMRESTEEDLAKKYDKYGDSYTEPATKESLKYAMKQVEELENCSLLDDKAMADLDIELFGGPSPFGIFRLCFAYIDKYSEVNNPHSSAATNLDGAALSFCFYGGVVEESFTENTTHVIIDSRNTEHLQQLQEINHSRPRHFHIVGQDWVEECIRLKSRLSERLQL